MTAAIKRTVPSVFMAAMVVLSALCGGCGGGGGGSGGGGADTGGIAGYVDSGSVARIHDRNAVLAGVGSTGVTAVSGSSEYTTQADPGGYFTISGITPGSYIRVYADYGNTYLAGYYTVTAGRTTTKNVDARSTAAAIVYQRLSAASMSAPSNPSTIEASRLIRDLESGIEAALQASTYNYSTSYSSAAAQEVIRKVQNGGQFSDLTAPEIEISFSEDMPGDQISDVSFRGRDFDIIATYSDSVQMDFSALAATISMDGGTEGDISAYFSKIDESTVRSNDIYEYTRNMFDLPTNDTPRTMTVSISLEDMSGNTGSASYQFVVYPLADLPADN